MVEGENADHSIVAIPRNPTALSAANAFTASSRFSRRMRPTRSNASNNSQYAASAIWLETNAKCVSAGIFAPQMKVTYATTTPATAIRSHVKRYARYSIEAISSTDANSASEVMGLIASVAKPTKYATPVTTSDR